MSEVEIKKMGLKGIIKYSVLGVVIFFVLVAICQKKEKEELAFAVQVKDGYLYFRNDNSKAWEEAKITINNKYFVFRGKIDTAKTNSIPLSDFADNAGNRFNAYLQKINSICVTGDLDGIKVKCVTPE